MNEFLYGVLTFSDTKKKARKWPALADATEAPYARFIGSVIRGVTVAIVAAYLFVEDGPAMRTATALFYRNIKLIFNYD